MAILGSVKKDLSKDALGKDTKGNDIYFKNVWPSNNEVNKVIDQFYKSETFKEKYKEVNDGGELWENLGRVSKKFFFSDPNKFFPVF